VFGTPMGLERRGKKVRMGTTQRSGRKKGRRKSRWGKKMRNSLMTKGGFAN